MKFQKVSLFIIFIFSITMAFIKAYPLLAKINIVPQHRDVYFYPSLSLEVKHYLYSWEDLGSYRNIHSVLLSWFSSLLALFAHNDICIYSRLLIISMYVIASLVPSITAFKLVSLIEKIEKRKIPSYLKLTISLIITMFYSFNLYIIKLYTPPMPYIVALACILALHYILISLMIQPEVNVRVRYIILLSFILGIISAFGTIRYLVISLISILPIIIIFTALRMSARSISRTLANRVFDCCKILFVLAVLFALLNLSLNAYWLLPAIYASRHVILKPSYVVTIETVKMFSNSYSLLRIFSLNAIWWPYLDVKSPNVLFVIELIVFSAIVCVPILLISAFKSLFNKFMVISSMINLIIGIMLWHGINGFSATIYRLLLIIMPSSYRWILRVPEHFAALVITAYAELFMFSLVSLYFVSVSYHKVNPLNPPTNNMKSLMIKGIALAIILALIASSLMISMFVLPSRDYMATWFRGGFSPGEYYKLKAYCFRPVVLLYNTNIKFKPRYIGGPYVYINLIPPLKHYVIQKIEEQYYPIILRILKIYGSNCFYTDLVLDKSLAMLFSKKYSYSYEYIKYFNISVLRVFDNLDNDWRVNIIRTCGKLILTLSNNFVYYLDIANFEDRNAGVLCPTLSILPAMRHTLVLLAHSNNIESYAIALNGKLPNESLIIIRPTQYTLHHAPAKCWSISFTSDPLHGAWHPYLNSLGIRNWQSDYGYGLVFTWAKLHIPSTLHLSNNELYVLWTFNEQNECSLWRKYTPYRQFNALQSLMCHNGILEVKLYNSTWGWKTVRSPLIPVDPNHAYRFVIRIRGVNAHKVHVKVAEFDSSKKLIDVRYVKGVGDGTFGWREVVFDYVPSSSRVRYVQLQIWHGHLTDKPLPNIIEIDYVKVYDVTRYAKRVTLDMPFNVPRSGRYKIFVRYFENQKGGAIRIYLDGEVIAQLNTTSQLNRFVWRDLGTYELSAGKHVLTLENGWGFNAVNVFLVIPVDEYSRLVKELDKLLENKTIIYIFEAESDMFRVGAKTVKDINASNGELLLVKPSGCAWQRFEVVKEGYYTVAIRINGSAMVKIDNKTFKVSSNSLDFKYIESIYLKRGLHTILIKPITRPLYLDVVWIYSVNSSNSNKILEDLSRVKETTAKVISYRRVNPTLWKAKVIAKKSFMLVFAESYDPLWEARVYKDGELVERVGSIPVYGVINGFWINETGNLTIVIRYVPQDWFELGLKISITTFALSVFYLAWSWRRCRGDRWAVWLERRVRSIPRYLKSMVMRSSS